MQCWLENGKSFMYETKTTLKSERVRTEYVLNCCSEVIEVGNAGRDAHALTDTYLPGTYTLSAYSYEYTTILDYMSGIVSVGGIRSDDHYSRTRSTCIVHSKTEGGSGTVALGVSSVRALFATAFSPSVPALKLSPVGYPRLTGTWTFSRSATRTRGRVPFSKGTRTRVVRVPGYPDNTQ